jgi:Zn-dependent peptidase ImmA (M78 family)
MYKLPITIYGVSFDADYTRGMLLRFNDRAVVYVRHQLESDWRRFTAVKEVCHIILDEQEDWSTDGVQTIADLQNDLTLERELGKATSQSETLAELAAIELMYPWECRMADLKKLANGETTEIKIALEQRMPPAMVSRALSPAFQRISSLLWSDVQQAEAAE